MEKLKILRRRQKAYENLNNQMDQAQNHLKTLKDWDLLISIEIRTVINPNPNRYKWLELNKFDLIELIKNENAHILRITKELNTLEDRGCR